MSPNEARLVRNTVLTVVALVALRLVAAAFTPLTFDEAYYWMWSKHLAGGYYDHPPMVALVIRLGTMIAGDTELGVRLVSILLALPMSCAVYRAAAILFGGAARRGDRDHPAQRHPDGGGRHHDRHAGCAAAGGLELRAVFLAKVLETGRGAWWLAVGAAVGAALLSKYTALFFGPAILIWLVGVAKLRRWLLSPWPYLGGLVALALFAPVILWNADHHWVSFIKQIGPRQDRGFQAGLHRRTDSDPDRVRDAAGVHPRRDGALRARLAQCRRARRAHADQFDVLDHRGLFRLALAARPCRGQLVRAGVSRLRDRRRGRRALHAVGAAGEAPCRFLPALGRARAAS